MARRKGTDDSDRLLFPGHAELGSQEDRPSSKVDCLGMTFASEEDRRDYFLAQLQEKLRDPEFRKIPGFPNGSDEAILRLSDPPWFTACPNPFFADLVKLAERRADGHKTEINTLPYVADIREGRGHAIYQAHSYHTKVPHQAIMRFILHYTKPGDVVLDGFGGTGMTGVAAQLCGSPPPAFRREVEFDFVSQGLPAPHWGARQAVIVDLAPAASFIAAKLNSPVSKRRSEKRYNEILDQLFESFDWMFRTRHSDGGEALINYVIWSDVFSCGSCASEVVYWDAAVDLDNGEVRDTFNCPSCRASLTKRTVDRVFTTVHDEARGKPSRFAKSVPVLINYGVDGLAGSYTKAPDEEDRRLLEKIDRLQAEHWYPTDELPEGDKTREPKAVGLTHVHHFYTKRSLLVLSWLRARGLDTWLPFSALTPRATKMHRIAASRLGGPKKGEGGATVGIINGTLYVPSISAEMNVLEQTKQRIRTAQKTQFKRGTCLVGTGSCSSIPCPSDPIDYIFTDPPFGSNLVYSELNFLWESWLGVFTNNSDEAIISKSQEKGVQAYQRMMLDCFTEHFRVLKPGRWLTVEFSNTSAAVWNAIQVALEQAGFVVANVSALNKKQGSFNAVTTVTAVKQDLIISCYKPTETLESHAARTPSSDPEAFICSFVNEHLTHLPIFVEKGGRLEVVVERQGHRLHDRLVAFHVKRRLLIPVSVPELLAVLNRRYSERDGVFFLPGQVAEYDRKRMSVGELRQLTLFPRDEASAIQWLRQQLERKPQRQQDLTPLFHKEIHGWAKHEKTIDIRELLEQSFLRYDSSGPIPHQIVSYLRQSSLHRSSIQAIEDDLGGLPDAGLETNDQTLLDAARDLWYVPNPNHQGDLGKARERQLLREFEEYRTSKQRKINEFRTEAVRAGFKAAYDNQDYRTILDVWERLPEKILQEDDKLLMYYDVAGTRLGEESMTQ